MKDNSNLFLMDKVIVQEILDYHIDHNRAYKPLPPLNSLNSKRANILFQELLDGIDDDLINYHTFLIECQHKVVTYKWNYVPGRYQFFRGFRNRMYAYKKDKDWKNI